MAFEKNIEKIIALGDNTLPAKQIFLQKNFYYDKVYPDGKLPWLERPIDFINENPLYGKVDLEKDFIYPKVGQMRRIKSGKIQTDNMFVFDFVASAFEDLRDHLQAQANNGHIQLDDIIAPCDPKKSFLGLETLHKQFKEHHWAYFSLLYLSFSSDTEPIRKFPLKEQISNFSQFIKYYMEFLKTAAPEFPITLSGVLNTTHTSPLLTGLCIEIHDEAYDDDSAKQKLIDSPNYNFFKCAARNHGFVLDRNVPWRLVADVTSYKMREYMRIAHEKPQIEEEQDKVLKERLALLQSMTPEDVTMEDIINFDIVDTVTEWDQAKILNFQTITMEKLQEVKKTIADNNVVNWEKVQLRDAVDPQVSETGALSCDDGNVCSTRVMKSDFFFKQYYNKAYLEDVWGLRQMLWQFWTSWVENHPYTKKVRTVGCVESGFKTKVVEEKEVQHTKWDTYLKEYGELFWLKFYFDVKTLENKIKWSHVERKRKMKKINFLHKAFDFYRVIGYINKVTKDEMLEAQDIYVSQPELEESIPDWF